MDHRLRILSLLFFAFNYFFQSTTWFGISYFNCKISPFIYAIWKKVFLKGFVLDTEGLIAGLIWILRNLFETGSPNMSRESDNGPFIILHQRLLISECQPSSSCFVLEVPWITPVIAREALYWIFSNLLWKISLFGLSYKISSWHEVLQKIYIL